MKLDNKVAIINPYIGQSHGYEGSMKIDYLSKLPIGKGPWNIIMMAPNAQGFMRRQVLQCISVMTANVSQVGRAAFEAVYDIRFSALKGWQRLLSNYMRIPWPKQKH